MALRKTAIAVPADVLDAVDEIARARHESRSSFITRILRAALRAKRDRDIMRKLEDLFGDPNVREQASRAAEALDRFGTDWTDERW